MLPSLSKAVFSVANVEKVVNPPQNPIVRNILHSGDITFSLPAIMPANKQPIMLTVNVP